MAHSFKLTERFTLLSMWSISENIYIHIALVLYNINKEILLLYGYEIAREQQLVSYVNASDNTTE
jgi:hypothetical protein